MAYTKELIASAEKSQHHQLQSPLFGRTPAELRNNIFDLALSAYQDMSCAFHRDRQYWRPNYLGPIRQNVTLLRTCKRVWLETWNTPDLKLGDRTLHLSPNTPLTQGFCDMFPIEKLAYFKKVRFFNPKDDSVYRILDHLPTLRPHTFIMTMRLEDWSCNTGFIFDMWFLTHIGHSFHVFSSSINQIIMEFEMIKEQESHLDGFISAVRKLHSEMLVGFTSPLKFRIDPVEYRQEYICHMSEGYWARNVHIPFKRPRNVVKKTIMFRKVIE
ncbi:hypothetical protein BS50DRAFT_654651 [Corynespora cassiicola Philippines]|uniref:Uncharacterized protein n=1 Tax=Corynespora cassiicola Philippines TaxID=1448308 RepID=A0A2T2N5M5_CORCC|nr:hypothetical protein BS50DRAFT_654651 [Corynespora cassiicola Philippines]